VSVFKAIFQFQLLKTLRLIVLTKVYEIPTRKSPKVLHINVLSHFEKSSSPLSEIRSRIAATKATISATIKRKPASTKNILNKRFCTAVQSSLGDKNPL
jgi:hypothetical protein